MSDEYTFDISNIEDSKIENLHQEGNYLVGLTNYGIKFRQRIPQSKILNKVNDKYVLEDINIR